MLGMAIRAYARHRGVSHTAVQKAIRSGRIREAVLADGSIDAARADQLWIANTDPTKPRNSVTGDPKHRRDPAGPSQPMGTAQVPGTAAASDALRFLKNRNARESYVAGLKRLDYLERIGKLVRADEVNARVFDLIRMLSDRLQALPDRLESALEAAADRAARHEVLRTAIDEALDELERACAGEGDRYRRARAAAEERSAAASAAGA